MSEKLISRGGFCAPPDLYTKGHFEVVQHTEPRPWLWLHRLRGWPDYWEEVVWRPPIYPMIPQLWLRDVLPSFSAMRGGIDFTPRLLSPLPPLSWWENRKQRLERARVRLAYRIAPSLRDHLDDW